MNILILNLYDILYNSAIKILQIIYLNFFEKHYIKLALLVTILIKIKTPSIFVTFFNGYLFKKILLSRKN